MVSTTRNRGRGKTEKIKEEVAENEGGGENGGNKAEYEETRAQRIKENMERMKGLGIFDLSQKLKRPSLKPSVSLRKMKPSSKPSNNPSRRSSRLKDLPRVIYVEKRTPKKENLPKKVKIHITEGENPEIYTEEHEKLLGDSKAEWTLLVDGYDENGDRVYDPVDDKSCHQCRQKTLGHHTECSKCGTGLGQFCGDCLYKRYGENITEVNRNPDWICPGCRGICNCSRCRKDKGFAPTGAIYWKVVSLGYKSVAHYLIYTRRGQSSMGGSATENPVSSNESLSPEDKNQELSDAVSFPPLEIDSKKNEVKDDMPLDSD